MTPGVATCSRSASANAKIFCRLLPRSSLAGPSKKLATWAQALTFARAWEIFRAQVFGVNAAGHVFLRPAASFPGTCSVAGLAMHYRQLGPRRRTWHVSLHFALLYRRCMLDDDPHEAVHLIQAGLSIWGGRQHAQQGGVTMMASQ